MDHDTLELELSRTQKRKKALELLSYTKQLASYSPKSIEKMELPSEVKLALNKAQEIKSPRAASRQLKYTAGLIRSLGGIEILPESVLKGKRF